jgi:hypothetical protein
MLSLPSRAAPCAIKLASLALPYAAAGAVSPMRSRAGL